MDEQIVADAVNRIGAVAVHLHRRGDRDVARALADQVRRIQKQLRRAPEPGVECRGCGGPVPSVRIGRPREFCMVCRPPHYKVDEKVPAGGSLKS